MLGHHLQVSLAQLQTSLTLISNIDPASLLDLVDRDAEKRLIRTNPASIILESGPSELQVSIDEESFLGKVGPVAKDSPSA